MPSEKAAIFDLLVASRSAIASKYAASVAAASAPTSKGVVAPGLMLNTGIIPRPNLLV